jgi:uncharacterized protein YaaN involved in tellurite resistance
MTEDKNVAEESSRRRRARNSVIEYAEAKANPQEYPGLCEQMDKLIQPIALNPDSFQVIITYGTPPLEELGKVASSMIQIQSKFNDQVNVMASSWNRMQEGMKEAGFETFIETAQKALKTAAGAAGKGVKGGFSIGKNILESFNGAKNRKGEEDKMLEEMQESLPQMAKELQRLINDISKTEQGINQVLQEAEKLGIARLEATRALNLYIGAGKEVLRRYDEEWIPEAKEIHDETADPDDKMYLDNVLSRKDDFTGRLLNLEGSRTQSVVAAQQLRQIMETLQEQLKKIQEIKYNSRNEWQAMLAAAGIAGSNLKSAQMLKEADEFGDRMFEQTTKMVEKSAELTRNTRARGSVDPQKLIDAAERLQKVIESDAQASVDRAKQLESLTAQLRSSTEKLLETSSQVQENRILEGVETAKKNA